MNVAKALADAIPADFRIVTNKGHARSGLTGLEVWEMHINRLLKRPPADPVNAPL